MKTAFRNAGILLLVLSGLLWPGPARGATDLSLKIFGQYFVPAELRYEELYGKGPEYGGKIEYRFTTNAGIWLSGCLYRNTGELSFTKEETTIQVLPLATGFTFHIPAGPIRFYLDGGVGVFLFEEDNPIGRVTSSRLGVLGRIGTSFPLGGGVVFDAFARYTSCKIRPGEIEADIGGWSLGVGLGYRFRLGVEDKEWEWREIKSSKNDESGPGDLPG